MNTKYEKDIKEELNSSQDCERQSNMEENEEVIKTNPTQYEYKIKKEKKYIFSWIISIFMFLSAVLTTPYTLANTFMLLLSLITCPLFFKYINLKYNNKLKTSVRIISSVVLVVLIIAVMPSNTGTQNNNISNLLEDNNIQLQNTSKNESIVSEEETNEKEKSTTNEKTTKKESSTINKETTKKESTTSNKENTKKESTTTNKETTKKEESSTTSDSASTVTVGEKNALSKAKSYLNAMAFSYKGLIKQLEFEGFTTKEATYGADKCGANWNAQALKKAKSYLNSSAFSYKGLVKQLEYEEFTSSQAKYGVDNCGADWNAQAAKKAKSYMSFSSFSRSGLIEQLKFEGFTNSQAEYGAGAVGY